MKQRIRVNTLACLLAVFWFGTVCAGEGPELVQAVKNGDDGIVIADHVGPVTARGNYVYAAVHYQGQLKYFKRDLTIGKLTYAGELVFDKHDMSAANFVWANGRLYLTGGSGHETGDQDSRGLHWLEVDPATGKPLEKGKIDIPLAASCGGLAASPDEKCLYLLLTQKRQVIRYQLAADGTPQKTTEAVFPGQGGMGALYISPDGRMLYATGDKTICRMELNPDGSMVFKGSDSTEKLTEGIDWPQGKWGYGWGGGFGVSPDGQCVYAAFCNYGGKDFRTALFLRDPKTGVVAFKERMDEKTGPTMVKMAFAFEPDGTRGYYVSGPETSGNVVGWFNRDPKTGLLSFGGVVKGTGGGPTCLYLDPENGFLYVGTWSSKQLFVMKTGKKTPVTKK